MRISIAASLLTSAALLAGCNTVRGVGSDVQSVASAFDPNTTYASCGSYGMIDRNFMSFSTSPPRCAGGGEGLLTKETGNAYLDSS